MDESIPLGRIAGIRVGANWSLVLMFGLIVFTLTGSELPHAAPGYSTAAYTLVAVAAVVVFYASLLAHELAHALVARRRGIQVEGIVLWVLGGVSKLKSDAVDAAGELRIAIAGPATSLALGLGFFGLSRLAAVGEPGSLLAGTLGWLGWVNALLAAFNLLPAFPLDGGRVLRSLLWRYHGDKRRATSVAAWSGRLFGFGFVGLGLLAFAFGGGGISGLWLAVIGWFLVSASKAEGGASALSTALGDRRVRDAMTPEPLTVPAWVTLDRLVEEGVNRRRLSSFPVVDWEGGFAGLVTVAHIRSIPPELWAGITAQRVARPAAQCVTCSPDDDLAWVAGQLSASPDRRAVVLDGRRIVGILAPSDLRRTALLGVDHRPASFAER
jgi:Zn-dependent protease